MALIFFLLFVNSLLSTSGMCIEAVSYECYGRNCPTSSIPLRSDEGPSTTVPIKCNGTESLTPDPADCHSFYHCRRGDEEAMKNETAVKLKCPRGYAFHPQRGTCTPASMVQNCTFVFCPEYMYDGVVPDPKDCMAFYRCMHGFPMRHRCRRGSIFNPNTGRCDKYQEVPECLKKPEPTTTTILPTVMTTTLAPPTSTTLLPNTTSTLPSTTIDMATSTTLTTASPVNSTLEADGWMTTTNPTPTSSTTVPTNATKVAALR